MLKNQELLIYLLIILLVLGFIFISIKNRQLKTPDIRLATLEESELIDLPTSDQFLNLNYSDQLKLVKQKSHLSPKRTWQYLKSALIRDNEVVYPTSTDQLIGGVDAYHTLGHVIGNELYRHYGFDGIIFCDRTFAYSCSHGVTEEAIRQKGPTTQAELIKSCYKLDPQGKSRDTLGCVHGIGHGLLSYEGLDVTKALADCDNLELKSPGDRRACIDGVFMEKAFSAPNDLFNSDNAYLYCQQFKPIEQSHCSVYIAYFLRRQSLTTLQILSACSKIEDQIYRSVCTKAIYGTIGFMSKGDIQIIKDECSFFGHLGSVDSCIVGATGEVKYQKFKSWKETVALVCQQNYHDTPKCPLLQDLIQ